MAAPGLPMAHVGIAADLHVAMRLLDRRPARRP
jgi:hypothetical protein